MTESKGAMTRTTDALAKRRVLRWGLVLTLVLVVISAVFGLALTGKMVVPGVSERVFPIGYPKAIALAAGKYKVDPYLLAAVARAESKYDASAVSRAGAIGVMQLMPETAAWITGLAQWQGPSSPDLTDPQDSVELGACYLAYLAEVFNGHMRAALAAYNAGQGTVKRWVEEAGGLESFSLEDVRFPETRQFVERVEHYWQIYRRVYKDGFPEETGRSL
ncbi:MAG: lytic transglycosylase domain-containing protein [Thermoleophilia bacterium]|nr:lytic transglycosylase domain-containing protein [Thermoleophilia bacterium]